MPRRLRLLAVLGIFLLAAFGRAAADPAAQAPAAGQPKQPNILFLFADDLAWDATAFNGNPVVKTPNLDRLAAQGVNFTHAHNMGAWTGAVCVSSRTMLHTGRFLWHAGALDLKAEAKQQRTWAQLMAGGGYATYMTGKWHVDGLKPQSCFGQCGTVRAGMPVTTQDVYQRPAAGNTWEPWDTQKDGYWKGGKHWSEVTADESIAFLKARRGQAKPFFAYVAFNAPHDPRQAPKTFVDLYPPERVDVPRNFLPLAPHYKEIGCGPDLRDERLAPFPRTEDAVRLHRGEYYALISHLDAQIGRILDTLEANGQAESTVVIFTADHGLACGHHGLMGKQNMYEDSLRTAFLLRGPGIPAGAKRDTRVYLQDALPTALACAGIQVPDFVEFKSVLPLIQDPAAAHYESIYGCYLTNLQRCVIHGDWKLVHYPKADVWQLFNLAQDPDEMHNLAAMPENAATLADMRRRLADLEKNMDDPILLPAGAKRPKYRAAEEH